MLVKQKDFSNVQLTTLSIICHMVPIVYSLFWLLVASLVMGAAMPLMQYPYYHYTGAHFADLRITG